MEDVLSLPTMHSCPTHLQAPRCLLLLVLPAARGNDENLPGKEATREESRDSRYTSQRLMASLRSWMELPLDFQESWKPSSHMSFPLKLVSCLLGNGMVLAKYSETLA